MIKKWGECSSDMKLSYNVGGGINIMPVNLGNQKNYPTNGVCFFGKYKVTLYRNQDNL